MYFARRAFTLIELLVVIAIIAILSVVVILTLNPAELLRQSHDSNRVSDMTTLNSALGVYSEDQSSASSFNMGSSSVVYVSIPDSTATSTAGDQCQGLSLPTLPTAYAYHCAASSTFRNTNGTGWIPVNFSSISSGSPIGNLAVDPVNQSSSRLYYTYTTNGTNYEVTSAMESQKYGVGGSNDVISNDGGTLASVYEKGSKLGLEPLDYGDTSLVGYWSMNEGTSTVVYDSSGNNNTGTWSGTQVGTNGYYTTNAKVGPYAGDFDGSTDRINTSISATSTNGTISAWINPASNMVPPSGTFPFIAGFTDPSLYIQNATGKIYLQWNAAAVCPTILSPNTWQLVVGTWTNATLTIFLNGIQCATVSYTPISSGGFSIGGQRNYQGYIDDVRIYNRALSAAQISAMYTGGK